MKISRIIFGCCLAMLLTLHGCSISPDELKSADQLMESRPDSALKLLLKVHHKQFLSPSQKALYALLLSKAFDKNDSIVVTDSLIDIATSYYGEKQPELAGNAWLYKARCARNRGNATVQASSLLKAQQYAETTNAFKLKGLIYCDKADMYQSQQQIDSAIILNKKGLYNFMLAHDIRNICLTNYSIGTLYSNNHLSNDSSIYYFSKSLKLAHSLKDPIVLSTAYKALGLFEYYHKNYRKALHYCQAAPITGIALYDENRLCIIAYNYFKLNSPDSAIITLAKIKNIEVISKDYYGLRQQISENQRRYQDALYFSKKYQQAKDSLNTSNLHESFAGMERKFKYEQLYNEYQELTIKNKQRGIIILIILLILSFVTIVILSWRSRAKKKELEMLVELNKKEKILLQQANENNDLLQRQNNMQLLLLKNLEQIKTDNISVKTRMPNIEDVKFKEEIITHINSIHNNIIQRLIINFPDLTQNDLIICAMLLAKYDTGIIARILNIKLNSVITQRARIRKRLKLENGENLIDYLRSF